MITFDFDQDNAYISIFMRIIVLLFPLILIWLFSIIGFLVPLQDFDDWILFFIYWSVLEFLVMLYFLGDMKNKTNLVKKLFLNWGILKMLFDLLIQPSISILEEGLSKEDSYRIQYAGIAFFSIFLPWIVGIITIIMINAIFSVLS
ncbi:MAG TPA: hypothetical protein VI912_03610 [Candidatus Bilamarchaeaceae archaeon]|nr:hypothetical protein [Candidatus Bilamarchaeaceae archaeon]